MERITRFRAQILLLIFLAVAGFFAYRLYDLQIIETKGDTDNTSKFTVMTRVKAARGDILDRNGNVLVSNRASYDLIIYHDVLKSAEGTNNYLYQLVNLCQELEIDYTEHFPVTLERPFTYTLKEQSTTWQSYFQVYLAKKPKLDSDITAPVLVDTLRKYYRIPEEWSDEVARRVIGLRYELDLRGTIPSLSSYVFLSDVSDEALSAIMELSIPGMKVEASTVREYNTRYAAHILGYVGKMNATQWEEYKSNPDYSMDSEIGQTGFEAAFEEYLHGVDAWRIDEITADGTVVNSYYMDDKPPKAGANVEVAIDISLQSEAESKLELLLDEMRANPKEDADGKDAQGGAVVAMDVRTGQVLVCASYPTYDPSSFFDNYDEILNAPYNPLYNRALNASYPPGSTYKMSMVIAAIHEKYIDSDDTIFANGRYMEYADADFTPACLYYTNSGGAVHGYLTASEALMVSCNYFFYDLADHLKMSVIDATAKGLGLGEPTGIELPEDIGHRANPETKKKLYTIDNGWYAADQILAGIGQSDNKFTPMQLCVYASTLANQGTRYRATFLNRVVSADYRELLYENEKEVLSYMEISDEAFLAYKQGMIWVAHNKDRGTARATFGDYPITIAAKTGTAETGLNIGSDNGAFICFAPADDPKIAIAVYGERAGHGSSMAAVAKAILDVYFEVGEIGDVNVYENQLS